MSLISNILTCIFVFTNVFVFVFTVYISTLCLYLYLLYKRTHTNSPTHAQTSHVSFLPPFYRLSSRNVPGLFVQVVSSFFAAAFFALLSPASTSSTASDVYSFAYAHK